MHASALPQGGMDKFNDPLVSEAGLSACIVLSTPERKVRHLAKTVLYAIQCCLIGSKEYRKKLRVWKSAMIHPLRAIRAESLKLVCDREGFPIVNLSKLFATGTPAAADAALLLNMTEIISSVEDWVEQDGIPWSNYDDQHLGAYILSSSQRPTGLEALAISLRLQLAAARARNQVRSSHIRSARKRYLGPTP